jgi:CubicO group peptidase (beta-lactamase class C family)
MRPFNTLFTIILLAVSISGSAQINADSKLFETLYEADRLLFEEGFNNCDLDLVEQLISDDFEFYHDINGVQDKAMFLKTFKESLCSTPDRKPIRKLVDGSLEVFPLSNEGVLYGALQKGVHEFYIKEPNKELYKTNVALFTSLWLIEGTEWKLKRVLSYDHQVPQPEYGAKFESNYPSPLFTSDLEIEALLAQHQIPSVGIGYISGGVLKQVRVFGEKSDGNEADCNTIYKVASLTKPVTAVITLKLVELGLWDLDEPIYNYYVDEDVKDSPELNRLTTRHILSHQAGFANWRHLTEAKKLSFEFEPGTQFQYSGEGYEYLRKALESKFNKGLETLADELLFIPLNMNHTHFYWDENVDSADYAVEHDEHGKVLPYTKHTYTCAAANLLTTVQDYGTFMAHIINGAGLSDTLFQEFITPYSHKKAGIDWGLGCQLLLDLNETGDYAVMHGGGDYGLKTIMLMFPKSKEGLLIFSNSENGMVVWRKIIEEYFGELGQEIVRRQLTE